MKNGKYVLDSRQLLGFRLANQSALTNQDVACLSSKVSKRLPAAMVGKITDIARFNTVVGSKVGKVGKVV